MKQYLQPPHAFEGLYKPKMHLRLVFCTGPWRAYRATDSVAIFEGLTLRQRERKGTKRKRENMGKGSEKTKA